MANVEPYDGSNYLSWKMHMIFIFQSRELLNIVSGEDKKVDHVMDINRWGQNKMGEERWTSYLCNSVGFKNKHQNEVMHCATLNEM